MYTLAAAQSITVGSTGWNTVDLTGAPYSVPTNASFAVLRVKFGSGALVEFRKTGSSYTVTGALASSYTMTDAIVPLSNGGIDIYTSAVTGAALSVYLIGYFESSAGVALLNPTEFTPTVPAVPANHPLMADAWVTITASSVIPSNAMWAVLQVTTNQRVTLTSGVIGVTRVRKTGTTVPALGATSYYLDRRRTQWFLAPVNTSGQFDIYGSANDRSVYTTDYRKVFVLGYITTGTHNASPTSVGTGSVTADATWRAQTSVASTEAVVLAGNLGSSNSGSTPGFGWRTGGTADAILSATGAGTASEAELGTAIAPLVSNQWEGYRDTGGQIGAAFNYYALGWITASAQEVSDTFTAGDTLEQDLYTREITEPSVAATDTLILGDTWEGVASPASVAATDTIAEDHARGAVVTETFLAADVLESEYLQRNDSTFSMADPADTLVFFGDRARFVFSSGDFTDAPDLLHLIGVTGMVGLAGDMTDAADTLEFTGIGGAYTAVSFSLSDAADTLYISIANGIDAATQEYILYAMNMKNGAVTKLPYAIDSMCELGGVIYAAGPAGIMIFEGSDTNNGAPIAARIAKGGMNFGTNKQKSATDLFMRVRSGGEFKVTSSSETTSGYTTVNDDIGALHGCKVDLPRGVYGQELGIAIENVAGSDLEIAELEYIVHSSLTRRGRQTRP